MPLFWALVACLGLRFPSVKWVQAWKNAFSRFVQERDLCFCLSENASACREALEDKGILRLDIPGFMAAAQEMVAPFGSGFW